MRRGVHSSSPVQTNKQNCGLKQLSPWEGASFSVGPKEQILRTYKVLFKTSKMFAKTEPSRILDMVSKQNNTLETKDWKNISAKPDVTGQPLVYQVDEASLKAIKSLGNRGYLGLNRITFIILSKDGSKSDSSKPST